MKLSAPGPLPWSSASTEKSAPRSCAVSTREVHVRKSETAKNFILVSRSLRIIALFFSVIKRYFLKLYQIFFPGRLKRALKMVFHQIIIHHETFSNVNNGFTIYSKTLGIVDFLCRIVLVHIQYDPLVAKLR